MAGKSLEQALAAHKATRAEGTALQQQAGEIFTSARNSLVSELADIHIQLAGIDRNGEEAKPLLKSQNPHFNFTKMLWDYRIDNSQIPGILAARKQYDDSCCFNPMAIEGFGETEYREVDLERLEILLTDPNGIMKTNHDEISESDINLRYVISYSFSQERISDNTLKAFEMVVEQLSKEIAAKGNPPSEGTSSYRFDNLLNRIARQPRLDDSPPLPENIEAVIEILAPHLGKIDLLLSHDSIKTLRAAGAISDETLAKMEGQSEDPQAAANVPADKPVSKEKQ